MKSRFTHVASMCRGYRYAFPSKQVTESDVGALITDRHPLDEEMLHQPPIF